jgi:hypothetical protein
LGVGRSARFARDNVGEAHHDFGAGGIVRQFGGLKCHGCRAPRQHTDESKAGEEKSNAHLFQATVEP